jgi:hypothetical protein
MATLEERVGKLEHDMQALTEVAGTSGPVQAFGFELVRRDIDDLRGHTDGRLDAQDQRLASIEAKLDRLLDRG